jgi:chromosome segregation ATPase
MAAKKGNGHDPATAAIVDVLERIEKRLERVENEAHATNQRLDVTNQRLERVEQGLTGLREEIHGFREETRDELTDLRGLICGERPGTVEARLAKLEAVEPRVAKLEGAVFRPTGT